MGFCTNGIFACLGVLLPFLLLQAKQAVTILVQQVELVVYGHDDFGIT